MEAAGAYERVMSADPDRTTHYYFDAQEALSRTRRQLADAAAPELVVAEGALARGDWAEARAALLRVLRIDPYNERARAILAVSGAAAEPGGD